MRRESSLVQCFNTGVECSHGITSTHPVRAVYEDMRSYLPIGAEDWSATTAETAKSWRKLRIYLVERWIRHCTREFACDALPFLFHNHDSNWPLPKRSIATYRCTSLPRSLQSGLSAVVSYHRNVYFAKLTMTVLIAAIVLLSIPPTLPSASMNPGARFPPAFPRMNRLLVFEQWCTCRP
jgi:hypothetical protein